MKFNKTELPFLQVCESNKDMQQLAITPKLLLRGEIANVDKFLGPAGTNPMAYTLLPSEEQAQQVIKGVLEIVQPEQIPDNVESIDVLSLTEEGQFVKKPIFSRSTEEQKESTPQPTEGTSSQEPAWTYLPPAIAWTDKYPPALLVSYTEFPDTLNMPQEILENLNLEMCVKSSECLKTNFYKLFSCHESTFRA